MRTDTHNATAQQLPRVARGILHSVRQGWVGAQRAAMRRASGESEERARALDGAPGQERELVVGVA